MKRIIPALFSVLFASIASAQVIYTVPENSESLDAQREREHPYAMRLLRVLTQPRVNIYIQNDSGSRQIRIFSNGVEFTSAQSAYSSQDSSEIDPETGQPLFFRMRDFFSASDDERGPDRPIAPPATRPSGPPYAHKGEVVIKPWRPAERAPAEQAR
jgi:hypothetical protein